MENRWEIISDNLDRIKKLGYEVQLNWKEEITISYSPKIKPSTMVFPIDILSYDYVNNLIDWLDIVEQVIDIFYSWYYENGVLLNNLIKQEELTIDEIFESLNAYNNITEMVNREISLQSILSEKKKWDF